MTDAVLVTVTRARIVVCSIIGWGKRVNSGLCNVICCADSQLLGLHVRGVSSERDSDVL